MAFVHISSILLVALVSLVSSALIASNQTAVVSLSSDRCGRNYHLDTNYTIIDPKHPINAPKNEVIIRTLMTVHIDQNSVNVNDAWVMQYNRSIHSTHAMEIIYIITAHCDQPSAIRYIRCSTAQSYCTLSVRGDICEIDFTFYFNGHDAYKTLSIYKLNDTLSIDAKRPLSLNECVVSLNRVTPFISITSFLYCTSRVSRMCKVPDSGNDTYTSITPFTSELTSKSTSPTTTLPTLSSLYSTISSNPASTIPISDPPIPESSLSTISEVKTTTTDFNWSYDTFGGLADIPLNSNNVDGVMKRLKSLLNQSIDENRTGPDDVYRSSLIIRNASRVNNLTQAVFITAAEVMDLLLQLPIAVFHQSNNGNFDSTNRVLRSLPDLIRNAPSKVEYMNGTNLGMAARTVDCSLRADDDSDELELEGIVDIGSRFKLITADDDDNDDITDEHSASIHIPLDTICRSQAVKSFFVIYRNAKFFVGNESDYQSRDDERFEIGKNAGCRAGQFLADHRILTASLLGRNATIKHLSVAGIQQRMAILRYCSKKLLRPLHGEFVVSHYLPAGGWSKQHCSVFMTADGRHYESNCFHLTDFTLLVNGMSTDPALCDDVLVSLGLTIGTGSVISLALLTAFYLVKLYPKGRLYARLSFILQCQPRAVDDTLGILYISGMFLFYVMFTYFTDQNFGDFNCTIVAAITYTLFLTSIIMTTFQSLKILSTFNPSKYLELFLRKASNIFVALAVGIGIPVITCIVTAIVNTDFFRRNDRFCWIRPDYISLAVVFPLSLVAINGLICFTMISNRLFPQICFNKVLTKQLTHNKSVQRLKIFTLILIQFTLGVPWIFQYFTIFIPHITVFHYLFNLVNGSQGVIMLLIFLFRTIHAHRSRRSIRDSRRLFAQYDADQLQQQQQSHTDNDNECFDANES